VQHRRKMRTVVQLLLVSAAATRADEFSEIFSSTGADRARPQCQRLQCTASNLRTALSKANRDAEDCAFSFCGDNDCSSLSLQQLCFASLYDRAMPVAFGWDHYEEVLCCWQLGAGPEYLITEGIIRQNVDTEPYLSKSGGDREQHRDRLTGNDLSRERKLDAKAQTGRVLAGTPTGRGFTRTPWGPAQGGVGAQPERRLDEKSLFCDTLDRGGSTSISQDREGSESESSESGATSDGGDSVEDVEAEVEACQAAYDCNDYFKVRDDLLEIIDQDPWQTPKWAFASQHAQLGLDRDRNFHEFNAPPSAPSQNEPYPEYRRRRTIPAASASSRRRQNRIDDYADLEFGPYGPDGLRSHNMLSLCERGDCRGDNVYPQQSDLSDGDGQSRSLCFEGMTFTRGASSWRVAMGRLSGALGCCADHHEREFGRDFVEEMGDAMYDSPRRRGKSGP